MSFRKIIITLSMIFLSSLAWGQASLLLPIGNSVNSGDDTTHEHSLTDVFPYGIDFGCTTYTTVWVGSNGYLTFGRGYTIYTPTGIAGLNNIEKGSII